MQGFWGLNHIIFNFQGEINKNKTHKKAKAGHWVKYIVSKQIFRSQMLKM